MSLYLDDLIQVVSFKGKRLRVTAEAIKHVPSFVLKSFAFSNNSCAGRCHSNKLRGFCINGTLRQRSI
jgi:hypothetical protein